MFKEKLKRASESLESCFFQDHFKITSLDPWKQNMELKY